MEHPSVPLITPFETEVQIDVEIAPLVQSLWKLGLCTFNSCQNNFGYVWLEFPSDDAVRFLTYIMQHGDPIISYRAIEPYDVSPQHRSQLKDNNAPEDSWLIAADVSEIGGKITIDIGIRFPRMYLRRVYEAICRALGSVDER